MQMSPIYLFIYLFIAIHLFMHFIFFNIESKLSNVVIHLEAGLVLFTEEFLKSLRRK